MSLKDLPKVDIHVHIEGTITPAMVKKLAARNGIAVPEGLIGADGTYQWQDDGTAASALVGFLKAYDAATAVMKTAADYEDVIYDYLIRSAAEGCIYAELTISPDHAVLVGIGYPAMLAALTKGYERARAETGIEARFIATFVRHYGPDAALKAAEVVRDNPHPLVTAVGLAGDENSYQHIDFKKAFDIAALPCRTAHAGEAAGPASVRAARDDLHVRRFGHMVRAVEDAALVDELKVAMAVPEVCVSSNMVLKVYPSLADHPLRRMFDAGLKVTLGSDDPPFFGTSIGHEYALAARHFGFSEKELLQVTKNAVEEAFVDAPTREKMLARVAAYQPKTL